MKLIVDIAAGIVFAVLGTATGAVSGGLIAHVLAEMLTGAKEALIPLAAGTLVGALLGAGGSLIVGVFLGAKTYVYLCGRSAETAGSPVGLLRPKR